MFPLFVPWNHRWDTAWTHPIVVRWGRSRRWRVEGDRKRPERAGRVLGVRHGRVLNEHHHTVNSSECAWHTVDEEVVLRECDASGSVVAPGTTRPSNGLTKAVRVNSITVVGVSVPVCYEAVVAGSIALGWKSGCSCCGCCYDRSLCKKRLLVSESGHGR